MKKLIMGAIIIGIVVNAYGVMDEEVLNTLKQDRIEKIMEAEESLQKELYKPNLDFQTKTKIERKIFSLSHEIDEVERKHLELIAHLKKTRENE